MAAPSSERWKAIAPVLDAVLDLAPERRPTCLAERCATDPELRREVERLLAAVESVGSFLEESASVFASPLVARVARQDLLAPGRFGPYEVKEPIGQGGMATVYLAQDHKHGRPVAIKVLDPGLAAVIGAERFRQEIEIAAALHHPHIMPLFDSGSAEGLLYYVMPLVRGESLRQRLTRDGQLPAAVALRITEEVAAALDFAHRQGVVHRDIKPENILLQDGQAIVADFGIARAIEAAGASHGAERESRTGTPAYMSPEQARLDGPVDGRADIYALGCVLYEMLAARPPFTGDTPAVILARHASEPVPPLHTLRSEVPPPLEQVVGRALAKAPGDRFASADAFSRALRDCGNATGAQPKRWTSRSGAMMGIGAALVASAIVTAFLLVRGEPRPVLAQRQLTFTGNALSPVFSPDGKAVLYVSAFRDLILQPLGGEPRPLVPRARFLMSPRWSGDGSAILFWMYRDSTDLPGTWMVSSTGGPARLVVRDMAPFDAGPDSTTILIAPRDKHRLELVDTRTGQTRRTLALPDSVPEVKDLAWGPDRRLIAFQTMDGRVWVLPVSGGVPQYVSTAITTFASHTIAWSPTGSMLYYLSGPGGAIALMRLEIDRTSGRASSKPRVILSQHDSDALDVGPGGTIVLTQVFRSSQVFAIEYDGGRPARIRSARALTTGTSAIAGGNISPDGNLVAFDRATGDMHAIEVAPFDGGPSRVLVRSKGRVWPAAWSPDGERLGYWEHDSTGSRLMQFDVRQSTSQRLTSAALLGTSWADWGAGGDRILFSTMRGHGFGILDLAGGRQSIVRLPDSLGTTLYGSAISPDGMQAVLSTFRRNADWAVLWGVSTDGRSWRRIPEPFGESGAVTWHPDGWIYLVNSRAVYNDRGVPGLELWRTRLPKGPLEFVAPLPEGCSGTFTLSANARRAACLRVSDASDLILVEGLDDPS